MGIDLSTQYLGLTFRNPLVVAASPLSSELHMLQRLEQAGAAAAVMSSLFEEQIEDEHSRVLDLGAAGAHSYTTSGGSLSTLENYNSGVDGYLRHIEAAKKAVSIPIVGSLNGCQRGAWVRLARLIQDAGADALELNIFFVPTDPEMTATKVEQHYLDVVHAVRDEVTIPLAVKIGPYFNALPNMARRLIAAGADGLVLFNRFLQPDIDVNKVEVVPKLTLSSREELRVALRWIAILRPQVKISLAATGGIHLGEDVAKALLAGADVAMIASALIQHGPEHLSKMLRDLERILREKGWQSVERIKGMVSHQHVQSRGALERANYVQSITSFKAGRH
jgi:dihydroorotate dehydrogenase (fumarate)